MQTGRVRKTSPARHSRRERLPISFPVFLRGVDHNGQPFRELATALNISAGGMLVCVSRDRLPSSHVMFDMPMGEILPTKASCAIREVPAQVIWMKPHPRCKLMGVRFLDKLK